MEYRFVESPEGWRVFMGDSRTAMFRESAFTTLKEALGQLAVFHEDAMGLAQYMADRRAGRQPSTPDPVQVTDFAPPPSLAAKAAELAEREIEGGIRGRNVRGR